MFPNFSVKTYTITLVITGINLKESVVLLIFLSFWIVKGNLLKRLLILLSLVVYVTVTLKLSSNIAIQNVMPIWSNIFIWWLVAMRLYIFPGCLFQVTRQCRHLLSKRYVFCVERRAGANGIYRHSKTDENDEFTPCQRFLIHYKTWSANEF